MSKVTYVGKGTVVSVLTEEGGILDEHSHRLQDEGDEELDVDVVSGTAESPG